MSVSFAVTKSLCASFIYGFGGWKNRVVWDVSQLLHSGRALALCFSFSCDCIIGMLDRKSAMSAQSEVCFKQAAGLVFDQIWLNLWYGVAPIWQFGSCCMLLSDTAVLVDSIAYSWLWKHWW